MDKCWTNPWCPKCGGMDFNVDYQPAKRTYIPHLGEAVQEEEYLRWQCQRCGWVTHTHPKDYKEPK